MRHSWADPPHQTLYRTTRTCPKCGLQKVTCHDGPGLPWIEFWRDETQIAGTKTPPCEPVKEEASNAAA